MRRVNPQSPSLFYIWLAQPLFVVLLYTTATTHSLSNPNQQISLSLSPSFYNSLSHHHELRSRRYSLYYSSWCLHKRVDPLYTCTSYYILQIKGYIEPHIYISVQVNNQEKGSSGGAKRDSEANRRQCQKEEREEEKEADQGDGAMEKDGLSCQKTLFKCCFSSQGSQKWSVYYPAFSFILHVYIYLPKC